MLALLGAFVYSLWVITLRSKRLNEIGVAARASSGCGRVIELELPYRTLGDLLFYTSAYRLR